MNANAMPDPTCARGALNTAKPAGRRRAICLGSVPTWDFPVPDTATPCRRSTQG
jgi:hypothetical protein